MADLFGRDKSVVSRHLSNIFKEKELERSSVSAKNATTGSDGKTYQVDYFNLDVIISIDYRVNSKQGTQFRIWANRILKDYLTKGYIIDQKRFKDQCRQLDELKQTVAPGKCYREQSIEFGRGYRIIKGNDGLYLCIRCPGLNLP